MKAKKMRKEELLTARVVYGASGIVRAVKDNPNWDIKHVTENKEYYQQEYHILYNGDYFCSIYRLHGFGFSSDIWHPKMSLDRYKILQTLITNPNHLRVYEWGRKEVEIPEGGYFEN